MTGLLVARLVVARFIPAGAALRVVVDDTLFHRYGTATHGVFWQHDGSAKGRDGIGRGNCFVVVGLVVAVPFLARAICLPVLFRLHIPKSGLSKPDAARALVRLLARAFLERTIHVTADAAYRGPAWRTLPAITTFTARLASNSVLYALHPTPTGKRGHPAWKGTRLGTCADLAATAAWRMTRVTRYGKTETVHIAAVTCLWQAPRTTSWPRRLPRSIPSIVTYGCPRVTIELRRRGRRVNHKRVERIMRERGIVGITRRRRRSQR